jgi:hypothetical protein
LSKEPYKRRRKRQKPVTHNKIRKDEKDYSFAAQKIQNGVEKEYLLKEAERFRLKNQVIGMLEFLETHRRPEGQPVSLPTWNEFMAKANDYAVIA